MKAKFHIPDIWVHKDLNLYLIDMIKNHPEFFYDDIEIASCYGCFPSALWNGGRALGGLALETQIQSTIKAFNDRNVPIRYTFTNSYREGSEGQVLQSPLRHCRERL